MLKLLPKIMYPEKFENIVGYGIVNESRSVRRSRMVEKNLFLPCTNKKENGERKERKNYPKVSGLPVYGTVSELSHELHGNCKTILCTYVKIF